MGTWVAHRPQHHARMRCSTLLETQHVGHRRCFFMDCHSTSRTGQLDLSAILPYPAPLQVQASEVYRFVNIAGWLKQSIVTAAFTESATSRLLGAKLIVTLCVTCLGDHHVEECSHALGRACTDMDAIARWLTEIEPIRALKCKDDTICADIEYVYAHKM